MTEECNSLRFTITPYNESSFIITNCEKISTELDRHMLTVQSLQYNPSMKPFQREIQDLSDVLRISAQTLDEWVSLQRLWLYLSPIFESPDIMRQLPQESKKFRTVEHGWKSMMARTRSVLRVLECCGEEGAYQRARDGNRNLELIQRQLTGYLQTKR